MHAVGNSIDYKNSDDVTPDFGNDGYTYLLQYQFNELDESQMFDNFFFKSVKTVNHLNKQTLNAVWNTALQLNATMSDCIIYA
ncbi:hypothetical protein F442_07437 [Phytophthora nicotianae P10297]|uniref:Uncharacterized protein n=1 Tax=Phytophthora nicotianae P10297 TaxID=1317064 RepID=W2ZH62_PHYNI|nr:hypothetical protein F442_07437 [Phytophthora nicotianae P10297]